MDRPRRPLGFAFLVVFLALSTLLMLAGQTMAWIDYEFTVDWGLQESREDVSSFGVVVNRAFGASDTLVYIPLMIGSLIGLLGRKPWALLTTAAAAGISVYWSVTVGCMYLMLPGTPGYAHEPDIAIWAFIGIYAAFGAWALVYLTRRMQNGSTTIEGPGTSQT